ncbi:uncharacterized protein LOC121868412 [Homarus americanus]|uniref:uncharacterized protein LOC121868412 n=1 Tax=Homarus americanus TaxID=6706 RepID=UPI001C43C358|nr:uncharacterized protein LOC121868412 [Homarus americanus]
MRLTRLANKKTLGIFGVCWLVATFLTGLGMYMTSCSSHWSSLATTASTPKLLTTADKFRKHNGCGGSWTLREGYLIMVTGFLFNLAVLAVMVITLVIERRSITSVNSIRQDSPPDYDTLASSETPPPSYFELEIDQQNCDYNSSVTSTLTTPPPATHLEYTQLSSKIKSWLQKPGYPLGTAVNTSQCILSLQY